MILLNRKVRIDDPRGVVWERGERAVRGAPLTVAHSAATAMVTADQCRRCTKQRNFY